MVGSWTKRADLQEPSEIQPDPGYILDTSDPLDLLHLRSLVAIADCGGFHRAAAALHLSQSTVSQHVRQLERVFKEPLVEKAGRRTQFTIAGEGLLAEARRILAVHDEALQRLEVMTGPSILVGCTEHTAVQMLPELLTAIREVYPDRAVRFKIDRSAKLEEAVARGVLDIAVVLSGGVSEGIEIGPLRLCWYAAPGFPLPAAEQPWLLVAFEEPCGLRQRAMEALQVDGRLVVVTAESTTLEGVLAGARAGAGVALLPVTGRVLEGLSVLTELPDLGSAGLRVVTRRGIDPVVEQIICEVGRAAVRKVAYPYVVPA